MTLVRSAALPAVLASANGGLKGRTNEAAQRGGAVRLVPAGAWFDQHQRRHWMVSYTVFREEVEIITNTGPDDTAKSDSNTTCAELSYRRLLNIC